MTDKELLELAAKAADYGFTYKRKISNDAHEWTSPDGMLWQWNPLIDDGQALRLAVKLRLLIRTPHHDIGDYSTRPLVCSQDRGKDVSCNEGEEVIDDPYAATRRAIVRAAAEIGKQC